mmetsp:Transcript_14811/g.36277  ORF Transcript_14811/g.36277 Transcript_14811/m.36277 type:complete len:230 (+) Transcript_14811:790-1479(+)
MAGAPRTDTACRRGGRAPRKRARVSLSWPVTRSTSARSSTPLARPTLRYSPPALRSLSVDSISRLEGAAASACTPMVCRQSSAPRLRMRTVESKEPTARKRLRSWPSGTGPMSRHATSPLVSSFSISTSCPPASSSKYTSSPPESATTTCRALHATRVTLLRPGVRHSLMRLSAWMCRSPPGCACSSELSPSRLALSVGVVPRNPESLTSSTVSPMDSTRVALVKETTM